MKSFVFTVLLLAALILRISAINLANELDGIVSSCEKENKVDDNYNEWEPGNVTDSLNNKCFMKCVIVKSGVGNDKGEVFVDEVMKVIRDITECVECQGEHFAEMLQNCKSAGTAVEPCEKVYQWTICAKEKIDEMDVILDKLKTTEATLIDAP